MADFIGNLTAQSEFSDVPQFSTEARAVGGPGGVMNAQAQALLNRTAYLDEKQRREISNLDFITDPLDRAAILAGTSTVDHTSAILAMLNAAGDKYRAVQYGVMNSKRIASAIDRLDWYWTVGARIKLIPDAYPPGSYHITLTGAEVRLENAKGDGNMAAMISTQICGGLNISGVSPKITRSAFRKYTGNGLGFFSQSGPGYAQAVIDGCNFDDNAGLGMEAIAASYALFTNGTTFDRNGYGFQGARAGGWDNYADMTTGMKIAFGAVLRMRSHHFVFAPGTTARDNARDGVCINQGSYAIKGYIFAHGNGDGGVTVAADNTFSGLPGEYEPPYNLDLDIEASNNYSSGFAAYQPVHGLKLRGVLSNNGRVAGDLAAQASYWNAAYIAGGSTGLDVEVIAYDDRQYRVITASSSGVLTATGWVSGLKKYFPNVAIISGTDQSFKGYGKITAESSGSVTITPTAFNGVTLASIAVGDYVTQAVQHAGVSLGNNCQGQIRATGYGYHFGPDASISGRKIVSGGFASGQCVLLPDERRSVVQLLVNPSWDTDYTTGWTYQLAGGGSAIYDTTAANRKSAGALTLTAGTLEVFGSGAVIAGALQAVIGEFVEKGVWVKASGRGDGFIQLFWFIGATPFSTRVTHPGGGWKFLRIGAQIPANATAMDYRVGVAPGKTVSFDNAGVYVIEQTMDPREYNFPSRYLPL